MRQGSNCQHFFMNRVLVESSGFIYKIKMQNKEKYYCESHVQCPSVQTQSDKCNGVLATRFINNGLVKRAIAQVKQEVFLGMCVCGSARKLYDLCALQVIWSRMAGPVQANEPFEASSLFAKSRPAAHRTSISINFRFNCLYYSVAMDTSRRINFFFVYSNQTEALDHFGSFILDAIYQAVAG